MTSYQMIQVNNINDMDHIKLTFVDQTIGTLYLTQNWINIICTSPSNEPSIIIIEFSQIALKILSRTKYSRLRKATNVKRGEIYVFQYPDGNQTLNKGHIIMLLKVKLNIHVHKQLKSYGSPLLNSEFKVVGIQINTCKNSVRNNLEFAYKAITINTILDSFKSHLNRNFGGRTENEIWLEKLNKIPDNELILIGTGGYGKVYKYKQHNGIDLALKIVGGFGHFDNYKTQSDALEKEYLMVSCLDSHPRIILFFDLVRDHQNSKLMIIMEYHGKWFTCNKIIKANGPLLKASVIKYLVQIVEGVYFLHHKNIIHNDIKPSNILFNNDDNLKLCDFGIAINENSTSSTSTSFIRGSFHYISPERYNGNPKCVKSDIWSVGATFVEMISGHPLNYTDSFPLVTMNIANYKIFINGILKNEYLQSLDDSDFKEIIQRTLCETSSRSTALELLSIVQNYYKSIASDQQNQMSNIISDQSKYYSIQTVRLYL